MNGVREWKWRPMEIEKVEKSTLRDKPKINVEPQNKEIHNEEIMKHIMDDGMEYTKNLSKREDTNSKLFERGLIPQKSMNPFLSSNYLEDLETQNQFLKPINSNIMN